MRYSLSQTTNRIETLQKLQISLAPARSSSLDKLRYQSGSPGPIIRPK